MRQLQAQFGLEFSFLETWFNSERVSIPSSAINEKPIGKRKVVTTIQETSQYL